MNAPATPARPETPPDPVGTAAALADRVIGGTYYWSLSRGAHGAADGTGTYCFAIFPAHGVAWPDCLEPIAMRDDDDPFTAVWEALVDAGLISERAN